MKQLRSLALSRSMILVPVTSLDYHDQWYFQKPAYHERIVSDNQINLSSLIVTLGVGQQRRINVSRQVWWADTRHIQVAFRLPQAGHSVFYPEENGGKTWKLLLLGNLIYLGSVRSKVFMCGRWLVCQTNFKAWKRLCQIDTENRCTCNINR